MRLIKYGAQSWRVSGAGSRVEWEPAFGQRHTHIVAVVAISIMQNTTLAEIRWVDFDNTSTSTCVCLKNRPFDRGTDITRKVGAISRK